MIRAHNEARASLVLVVCLPRVQSQTKTNMKPKTETKTQTILQAKRNEPSLG